MSDVDLLNASELQSHNGDLTARDLINAAKLDGNHGTIRARINAIILALDSITRDDNTLQDGMVRSRNLHPEILRNFGVGGNTVNIYQTGGSAAGAGPGIDITGSPYNAVGDGVTDATSAIQAAVDAAAAAKTNVVIPAGDFLLTSAVNLPISGWVPSIIGVGDARIIQSNNAAFCFSLVGSAGGYLINYGFEISGITFNARNSIRFGSATSQPAFGGEGTGAMTMLGFLVRNCSFYGSYGAVLDPSYNTQTVPTYNELAAFGIGILASKLFNFAVHDCYFQAQGISVALFGCDVGNFRNIRTISSARHFHCQGIDTYGSRVVWDGYQDHLLNWRQYGSYLNATNHYRLDGIFWENTVVGGNVCTYLRTENDIETIVTRCTPNSYTDDTVPFISVAPKYGLKYIDNNWGWNGLALPFEVESTYWTLSTQDLVHFIGNDPRTTPPDYPGVRFGELNPLRFAPDNFENANGAVGSAGFPWEQYGGRWAIKYGADALTMIMSIPCKTVIGKRLRMVWKGRYRDNQGFYEVRYRFGDSGATTLISSSLIGFTNSGQYEEQTTYLTLPALGTNEMIQLHIGTSNDDYSLHSLELIPIALAPGAYFTDPSTDAPYGRITQMATRVGSDPSQTPPPDDKKTLLLIGPLLGSDIKVRNDVLSADTAPIMIKLPGYGDGTTRVTTFCGPEGQGISYRQDAPNEMQIGGVSHTRLGTWDKDPSADGTDDAVFTARFWFLGNGRFITGTSLTDDGAHAVQARGGLAVYDNWLTLGTAGFGRKQLTGANCRFGQSTLVAGSVTVACPSVTSASRLMYSRKTIGGTVGDMSYTINPGVGFTINSSSGTDTSVIDWEVVEAF